LRNREDSLVVIMNNFSFNEIQRKDFTTALVLWGVAEVVGFILFPGLGIIKPGGGVLRGWFMASLPIGLGGAILIAMTSRFVAMAQGSRSGNRKDVLVLLSQFGGWVGMVGVIYPLLLTCYEFFTTPVK
jgi:hypothetical protein